MEIMWDELSERKNSYFNCLQAVLAYICGLYGMDIDLAFAVDFGMRYELTGAPRVGDKFYPDIQYQFVDFYKDVYGLKIEEAEDPSPETIKKILDERKFCLLRYDAFYCHWNPAFQDGHIVHYALVKEIDFSEEKICIIDPYIGDKVYCSDIGTLFRGVSRIFSIYKEGEGKKIDFLDVCDLLTHKKSAEKAILYYNEAISDVETADIESFFEVKHSANNHLIIHATQMAKDDFGIIYLLWKYGTERYSEKELEPIFSNINNLASGWNKLKLLLVKINMLGYLSERNRGQIIELLKSQMEKEVRFFSQINEVRKNGLCLTEN